MMTTAQAQALAAFVARIRTDWDQPGILAAIGKARNLASSAAIGRALCSLAENRDLRTPALLAQPGKHWHQDGELVGPSAPTNNVRCPEHPINFMPCPLCEAKRCPPDPVAHADYLEAKAALAASHTKPTRPAKAPKLVDAESAAIARKRIDGSSR